MNKKHTIIIIAFIAGISSSWSYFNYYIKAKEQIVSKTIQDLDGISEYFSVKKDSFNNGFFSIESNYSIYYNNKKSQEKLLEFSYSIDKNPIKWLFSQKVDLNGSIAFQEVSNLNIKPINFNGHFQSNGSMFISSDKQDISFLIPKPQPDIETETEPSDPQPENTPETGMQVVINNFQINIESEEDTKKLKISLLNSKLFAQDLEDKTDNVSIDNLKLSYQSKLDDLNVTNLSIQFDKIFDERGDLFSNKFNLFFGTEKNNNNFYNVFLTGNSENFSIAKEEPFNFSLSYSLENLNPDLIEYLKKYVLISLKGEDVQNDLLEEFKVLFSKNITNGMTFNIKENKFSNNNNNISILGNINLSKTKSDFIDLTKNLSFYLKLESSGEISEIINTMFLNNIDENVVDEQPNIEKPTFINDKFNLDLKYENNLLTVNNFPAPTMVNYFIFNTLSNLNNSINITTSSETLESSSNDVLTEMEQALKNIK